MLTETAILFVPTGTYTDNEDWLITAGNLWSNVVYFSLLVNLFLVT